MHKKNENFSSYDRLLAVPESICPPTYVNHMFIGEIRLLAADNTYTIYLHYYTSSLKYISIPQIINAGTYLELSGSYILR